MKLFYSGMKVRVDDLNMIYGELKYSHIRDGHLWVVNKSKDGKINLSYAPAGSIVIAVDEDNLTPIYDEDLLAVLERKTEECDYVKKEVVEIANYICKNIDC